jgi:hypothetical protein
MLTPADTGICGETDADFGKKTIVLESATHSVRRMIPLGSEGTEALADHFEGYGHHGSREQVRRMLADLLERVSAFFRR